MIQVDWWTWKCSRCDFRAIDHLTVNPQQVVAAAIVRGHIDSHAAPKSPPASAAVDPVAEKVTD